jgi:hypothetical protein
VPELLASTTSEELTEWMAYEQLTGTIGPERGDVLHGILTATVANTVRGKNRRPARPRDFIPQWAGKLAQDWTEMLAAVRQANRQLGGTDQTEGGTDGQRAGGAPRSDRDGQFRRRRRR